MGALPIQFKEGTTRKTLKLDGSELYDVIGDPDSGNTLSLHITRKNGEQIDVPVTCRLDTADEVITYKAGGILQRFAEEFLESEAA
jgi:aconitate hydratase